MVNNFASNMMLYQLCLDIDSRFKFDKLSSLEALSTGSNSQDGLNALNGRIQTLMFRLTKDLEGLKATHKLVSFNGEFHNAIILYVENRAVSAMVVKGYLKEKVRVFIYGDANISIDINTTSEVDMNEFTNIVSSLLDKDQMALLTSELTMDDVAYVSYAQIEKFIKFNSLENMPSNVPYTPAITNRFIILEKNGEMSFVENPFSKIDTDNFEEMSEKLKYSIIGDKRLVVVENNNSSFGIFNKEHASDLASAGSLFNESNGFLIRDTEMYSEFDFGLFTSKVKRSISSIGKGAYEKIKNFTGRARDAVRNYRKNSDEKLREQLINNEIIPLFDEILEWGLSTILAVGSRFVGIVNPLVSIAIFLITRTILEKRTKDRKETAIALLKQEIEICKEKIEDARAAGNNQAKYTLIRLRDELQRKLDLIRYENRLR